MRFLVLTAMVFAPITTAIASSQQNIVVVVDGQVPQGYCWSPPLTKPGPLAVGFAPHFPGRGLIGAILQPGNYDVATVPYGDNWQCPTVGASANVRLTTQAAISVCGRFPYDEPSAGYLILLRGPYADGTAEPDRGDWKLNGLRSGMVRGRVSMPIYTHSGARYDQYGMCGYPWVGEGNFPLPDLTGTIPAVGPKRLYSVDRVPLAPCSTPPDVTVLAATQPQDVYVSYSYVDMLGRETQPSDPVVIPAPPYPLPTYAVARRVIQVPQGCCGYRVYAGYSPGDLHRQPVIDYAGSPDKWLWPLHLNQFVVHNVRTDTPCPSPSATVSSLLCPLQQALVAGANSFTHNPGTYNLYCPIILGYDSNNFDRVICGKAKYVHQSVWNNQALETRIPLLLACNYGDRLTDASFTSQWAYAGISSSDPYNGACCMSNVYERCFWNVAQSPESYGVLVDERSSTTNGAHTASELTFKSCGFSATNPVKLEGNQTAKVRFSDNCEFYGTSSNTRYPADTTGMAYLENPTTTIFDFVKGVNGNFRSLMCLCGYNDANAVIVRNIFIDGGCPVVVTYSGFAGGTVSFVDGEAINVRGQWMRLAEAPIARQSMLSLRGVNMAALTSSVSFMLNQVAIDSDRPYGEVVAPTDASWLSHGLKPQYPPDGIDGGPLNPAYYDFSKKRVLRYLTGYNTDVPSFIVIPTVIP